MRPKLGVLNDKNFLFYFLADLISNLGTGMSLVGINWFIVDVTSSSKSIAFFMSIQIFVILVLLPFAGTVADQFRKIKVLLWSNLLRGIFILFVCLIYLKTNNFLSIYVLAIVNGVGWAFYIPSSRGLIQELVSKRNLLSGNAVLEISLQIGFFVSAGLSGIVYKYWGFYAILLIDVGTFLVASLCLTQVDVDSSERLKSGDGFFKELSEGMLYLSRNKVILVFGIVMFIPSIVTIISNMVLPGYVSNHLGANSVIYGIADMFYGVGAFLSGLLANFIASRFNRWGIICFFFSVSIISLLSLRFNVIITGLIIAYLLFGLSNTLLRIIMNTVVMEVVQKSIFGRVYSIWNSFSYIIQIFALLYLGRTLDAIGVKEGYTILSLLMVAAAVTFLFLAPKIKKGFQIQNAFSGV